jgi:O-antigen ligase
VPKLILFLGFNVAMLAFLVLRKTPLKIEKGLLIAGALIGGFFAFKLAFSGNPWLELFGEYPEQFGLLTMFNLYLCVVIARTAYLAGKNRSKMVDSTVLVLILIAIIGILQKFGLNYLNISDSDFLGRSYSTLGSPNAYGFLMAVGAFLSLYFKKWYKVVGLIFIVGLIFSGSKASVLALIAGIILVGLTHKQNKIKLLSLVLSLTGVGIIALKIGDFGLRSLYSRFYIWQASLELSFSNLKSVLVGNPISSLATNIYEKLDINYFNYEPLMSSINSPHNVLLEILYNFGLVGLVIFLIGFLVFARKSAGNKKLIGLIAITFIFLMLNNLFIEVLIFACISLVASSKAQKENLITVSKKLSYGLVIIIFFANSYFIYLIGTYDYNISQANKNLLNIPLSQSYYLKNMDLAPYLSTSQNYITSIGLEDKVRREIKEKFLKDNFSFQIKNMSDEELKKTAMESIEKFNPKEIMRIKKELEERNLPINGLSIMFAEKYPREINPKIVENIDKTNYYTIERIMN